MAPVYALTPDQVAKGAWLKELIKEEAAWIGLKEVKGGNEFRVLDYGAGTGFLSVVSWPCFVDGVLASAT